MPSTSARLRSGGDQPAGGVAIEAVLTFFLLWVIFACDGRPACARLRSTAGRAIGFTTTLDICMGGQMRWR